jgi:hypothetical protein
MTALGPGPNLEEKIGSRCGPRKARIHDFAGEGFADGARYKYLAWRGVLGDARSYADNVPEKTKPRDRSSAGCRSATYVGQHPCQIGAR